MRGDASGYVGGDGLVMQGRVGSLDPPQAVEHLPERLTEDLPVRDTYVGHAHRRGQVDLSLPGVSLSMMPVMARYEVQSDTDDAGHDERLSSRLYRLRRGHRDRR